MAIELMATLALSLAGQVVGGLVGGPIGATIGRALGALAGAAVDNALFGETAAAGGACRCAAAGVDRGRADPAALWLEPAERQHHLGDGARGDLAEERRARRGWRRRATDETRIAASFAVALCEGEVHGWGASGPTGSCSIPRG